MSLLSGVCSAEAACDEAGQWQHALLLLGDMSRNQARSLQVESSLLNICTFVGDILTGLS